MGQHRHMVILESPPHSTKPKKLPQPTAPQQPLLLGTLSTYKLVTIVMYGVVRRYFHRNEFRRIKPFRMLPCLFQFPSHCWLIFNTCVIFWLRRSYLFDTYHVVAYFICNKNDFLQLSFCY